VETDAPADDAFCLPAFAKLYITMRKGGVAPAYFTGRIE
jgi:hypothetical protein